MGLTSTKSYRYLDRLLTLEAASECVLTHRVSGFLPLAEWEPYLKTHPDQSFAAFLRRGFEFGFRVGFRPQQPLRTGVAANHQSVLLNPETVSAYIAEEVSRGKLIPASDRLAIHTNPIGIIPKANQPENFVLYATYRSRWATA